VNTTVTGDYLKPLDEDINFKTLYLRKRDNCCNRSLSIYFFLRL